MSVSSVEPPGSNESVSLPIRLSMDELEVILSECSSNDVEMQHVTEIISGLEKALRNRASRDS